MVKLTDEQVKHVAKLANLPITDDEVKKYGEQLSVILEYVDQLDKVDTSGVEPTFNVSGQSNIYHQDEEFASLPNKNLRYSVKQIIGGE